ncbi:MAG: hypothetical protein AAFV36_06270 [Myxococcota bacterium]
MSEINRDHAPLVATGAEAAPDPTQHAPDAAAQDDTSTPELVDVYEPSAVKDLTKGQKTWLRIDLLSSETNTASGPLIRIPGINETASKADRAIFLARELGLPVEEVRTRSGRPLHAYIDLPNSRKGGEIYAALNYSNIGFAGSQLSLRPPKQASPAFKEGFRSAGQQALAAESLAYFQMLAEGVISAGAARRLSSRSSRRSRPRGNAGRSPSMLGSGGTPRRLPPALTQADAAFNRAYGANLRSTRDTLANTRALLPDEFLGMLRKLQPNRSDDIHRATEGFFHPPTDTVYLKKREDGTLDPFAIHTYLHEKAHATASPIYKTRMRQHFNKLGGFGASAYEYLDEGLTDYFAMKISGTQSNVYAGRVRYSQRIEALVGEETLRKAYFEGDIPSIIEVQRAVDQLRSNP